MCLQGFRNNYVNRVAYVSIFFILCPLLSLSLPRPDRKQTRRENLVVCVSGIDIDGSR